MCDRTLSHSWLIVIQFPLTHRSSPAGQLVGNSVLIGTLYELEYLYSASESLVIIISLLSRKLATMQMAFCVRFLKWPLSNVKTYRDSWTVVPWCRTHHLGFHLHHHHCRQRCHCSSICRPCVWHRQYFYQFWNGCYFRQNCSDPHQTQSNTVERCVRNNGVFSSRIIIILGDFLFGFRFHFRFPLFALIKQIKLFRKLLSAKLVLNSCEKQSKTKTKHTISLQRQREKYLLELVVLSFCSCANGNVRPFVCGVCDGT